MKQMARRTDANVVSWKPLMASAFLVAILLFLFALPSKALAAQPDIYVTIIPSTASFSADNPNSTTGKPAAFEVEVEVSNLTTMTLQNIRLCWFSNASITVNNLPSNNCLSPLPSLVPTGQYVWMVYLTRTGFLEPQNSVQFRVDYQISTGIRNGLARRYAFSTLTVQNLQPQSVQQVAQLTVLSSIGTVSDQQTGQIFLVIENKSNFELTVTKLRTKGPNFVTLDSLDFHNGKPIEPITIHPNQRITTAINVTANGPVPPGTQTLVFEVGVQWIDSGQIQTGNLVANQQVNVGVLGASEVVSLLGIPSLLVLPGFLLVTTMLLLKKVVNSPIDKRIQLSPATAEFWLVAITLSIVADAVYFLFTQHKFWVQYDLSDVVIIWIGSIAFAIALYLIVVGFANLMMLIQRRRTRRLTPDKFDSPVDILRKLDNQKLNLVRNYVKLKINGEEKRVFLLEPPPKDKTEKKTEYWVSPAIRVRWGVSNDPALLKQSQDTFNGILEKKNARDLADFFLELREKLDQNNQHRPGANQQSGALCEVSWKSLTKANSQDTLIHGPYKAKETDIDFVSSQQFIVEQEF